MGKEGVFEEEVFSYRRSKDRKVFISWYGQEVKILRGSEGDRFLAKMEGADFQEAQLIMAKVTGNFKRGNERLAAEKGK